MIRGTAALEINFLFIVTPHVGDGIFIHNWSMEMRWEPENWAKDVREVLGYLKSSLRWKADASPLAK